MLIFQHQRQINFMLWGRLDCNGCLIAVVAQVGIWLVEGVNHSGVGDGLPGRIGCNGDGDGQLNP